MPLFIYNHRIRFTLIPSRGDDTYVKATVKVVSIIIVAMLECVDYLLWVYLLTTMC